MSEHIYVEILGLYRCTVPLSVVIKEITRKKTILRMRILKC